MVDQFLSFAFQTGHEHDLFSIDRIAGCRYLSDVLPSFGSFGFKLSFAICFHRNDNLFSTIYKPLKYNRCTDNGLPLVINNPTAKCSDLERGG